MGSDLALSVLGRLAVLSLGSLMCGLFCGLLVTLMWKTFGALPPPGTIEEWHNETSHVVSSSISPETVRAANPCSNDHVQDRSDAEPKSEVEDVSEEDTDHLKHQAMAEAAVFVVASICSYYVAEALHVSGIISALCCGLMCKEFAVWNMITEAREYARSFYIVLSELAEHLLMLWVGLLYYLSLEHFHVSFSLLAFALVVASRALSVSACAWLVNVFSEIKVEWSTQIMMFGAGLRGAVALALVMQVRAYTANCACAVPYIRLIPLHTHTIQSIIALAHLHWRTTVALLWGRCRPVRPRRSQRRRYSSSSGPT